jgi:glycosidase
LATLALLECVVASCSNGTGHVRGETLGPDAGVAQTLGSWRDQVIYLVMPDRFANGDPTNDSLGLADCLDPKDPQKYHGGDYAGLGQRLGYVADVGATAVWITPAYLQSAGSPGHCPYHGYWADFVDPDDGAVEPRLGTAGDLGALVGALHAGGMRVILDMVVNHAGDHARLPVQHPDWFHDPATCMSLGPAAIYCPYRAGIWDFAQEDPDVAAYLSAQSAGWIERFAIDGVRMDTAKYVLPGYFESSWIPAVRAARPAEPLFLVAEVFSEQSADLAPYLAAGFDATFNFPLRRALVDTFAGARSVDGVATLLADQQQLFGNDRATMLVNMLDNHDVPRFATEAANAGATEDDIRRRLHLALAVLFTAPGIPQLYAGDELGVYGGDDPDNRRDMPAWAWSAADRAGTHTGDAPPDAQQTYALVQTLAAVRRTNPALSQGRYVEMWRQNGAGHANVLAYFRGTADSRAIVVINDDAAASGPLSIKVHGNGALTADDHAALADGTVLEDRLGAGAPATVTLEGGVLPINLPAQTAAIYTPAPQP